MKIGILVPFMNNFGQKGFYNSQEVGLAKSLEKMGNNIVIIKLDNTIKSVTEEHLSSNLKIIYLPAYKLGSNGIILNLNILKMLDLNKLVMFSDIQIIVNRVYKLCITNNIEFIPYIGSLQSSSHNKIIRMIMTYYTKKNINIYLRNKLNIAKTPYILNYLSEIGAKNTKFGNVGIDFELLKSHYNQNDIERLREEFGYNIDNKLILFVGRMEKQKNPFLALEIFKNVINKNPNYRMIMIGDGSLKEEVKKYIDINLNGYVRYLEKVKNSDMWRYYLISDNFINLNSDEIFGMAILEAMYYKCKVIAINAPGPNYIINNGENGILLDELNVEKFSESIFDNSNSKIGENAREHIINNFSWDKVAKIIINS